MKQSIFLTFVFFISIGVSAKDVEIVSQPADCLIKKTVPCTFKSLSRQTISIDKTELVVLKNAVIKITDFSSLNLEPVIGGFIVKASSNTVSIQSIHLSKYPSYADKIKDQIEVIDGKDFYAYRLTEGESERYLLDREPFIKKLSGFYSNVAELRLEYKNISPIYNKSFKKDVALHKQIISRKIASIEEEKKLQAERSRQAHEEKKRNKQTFFKRTFDQ